MKVDLKIHLLIISIIIGTLYFVQRFFIAQPSTQEVRVANPVSPYYITVAHASWGMNCLAIAKSINSNASMYKDENLGAYQDSPYAEMDISKIKEDNVLSAVSSICNGKPSCAIPIDPSALGGDPLPSCAGKVLNIEYRCFKVDKVRFARSSSDTIHIDCDKQFAQ